MKKALDETRDVPILNCCWYSVIFLNYRFTNLLIFLPSQLNLKLKIHKDNSKVFGTLGDNSIKALDVQTQQVIQVGSHDQPAGCCEFVQISNSSCLLTAGWDCKIKFWDLRQQAPAHQIELPHKIRCFDAVIF